jgi:hypothetical protein
MLFPPWRVKECFLGLWRTALLSVKFEIACVTGRLHVRFCERIGVRFGVQFAANGSPQVNFLFDFAEMCRQTIVMGVR